MKMKKNEAWKLPKKPKKPRYLDADEARAEKTQEERRPAGGGFRVVRKPVKDSDEY